MTALQMWRTFDADTAAAGPPVAALAGPPTALEVWWTAEGFDPLEPRDDHGRWTHLGAAAHELAAKLTADVPDAARAEVARGLAHQVEQAPNTAAKFRGFHMAEWGSDEANQYMERHNGRFGFYTDMTRQITLHPVWQHPKLRAKAADRWEKAQAAGWFTPTGADTPLQAVTAHEYGHHVANRFMNGHNLSSAAARELLPVIARELGLSEPPKGNVFHVEAKELDAWVAQHADTIRSLVSEYGSKSFTEMLAEIWQEYSTMGDKARPHVQQIGAAMRDLAEGSRF
jgi:hypothetical protein